MFGPLDLPKLIEFIGTLAGTSAEALHGVPGSLSGEL